MVYNSIFSQLHYFNYYRDIEKVEEKGWYKIVLYNHHFQNLEGDFSSIRIFKLNPQDTIDIPYVIERRSDYYHYDYNLVNEEIPVKRIDIKEDPRHKNTILYVEPGYDVPINSIQFFIQYERDYFYRSISVFSSPEKEEGIYKKRYEYKYVIWNGYLNSDDDHIIFFEPVSTSAVKIKIENHDDTPLSFDSLKIFAPVYEIYLQLDTSSQYVLAYGNSKIQEPKYDLVNFFFEDPEDLKELNLRSEIMLKVSETMNSDKQEDYDRENQKLWIWLIMIVVVMVLGYFTFTLLKGTQDDNN